MRDRLGAVANYCKVHSTVFGVAFVKHVMARTVILFFAQSGEAWEVLCRFIDD
jgi:hypothetical protein